MKRVLIYLLLFFNVFCSGGTKKKKSSEYRIKSYEITVKIPDSCDRLQITALMEIEKPVSDRNDTLTLILGKGFRGAKIVNVSVLDGQNNPLSFLINDSLEIKIPEPERKIKINYELLKDTLYKDNYSAFAFDISEKSCYINSAITRTDYWFPRIKTDSPHRLPEFILFINVPSGFRVMASGKLVDVRGFKTKSGSERYIYRWRNYKGVTDRSLYFFAIKGLKKVIKEYPDGFRVIMYVPENSLSKNLDYVSEVIHSSYRFFEKIYGNVPGDEYKIMSFNSGYSGLFNSMTAPMFFFTSEIKNNEIYFPVRSLIHEVSHTWWGNMVSMNPETDYWLFEGFAKYSEIIGIKEALGVDVEEKSFSRLKMASLPYVDYAPSVIEAGKSENRQLQLVSAYYQGAMLLKMLEIILGKENLFSILKNFIETFRMKYIDTKKFVNFILKRFPEGSKIKRENLKILLKDYLYTPGFGEYEVKKLDRIKRKNYFITTYKITNTGNKSIFTEFRIKSDIQDSSDYFFLRKGESIKLRVKSEKDRDTVIIDPRGIFPVRESGLMGAGGLVYRDNTGKVRFVGIVENSPLSGAGIRNNMILIKIEGESLENKSMEELNRLLLRPKGTILKLLVKEEGEEPQEVRVLYK